MIMPEVKLNIILKSLEGPPKVSFPTRYEKILRKEIIEIINKEMQKVDPDLLNSEAGQQEVIKELILQLDIKTDTSYAYQRTIIKTYMDYFRSLIPESKFNWQFETPEFYYAIARQEGRWVYYKIFTNKKHIVRMS